MTIIKNGLIYLVRLAIRLCPGGTCLAMVFLAPTMLGLFHSYCFAGGMLQVFPPEVDGKLCPVARPTCLISKTFLTVSDSSIEVKTEQVFRNDNDYSLDAVFVFPLAFQGPYNVVETLINGENGTFDILKPVEVFPILKKITCQTEDPAPLAICGSHAVVCPGIKLGIRESKSFRITYRVPFVVSKDEIFDMTVPMVGERYARNPIGEYEVLVRFKMSRAVRTSISPTNYIRIDNESVGRRLVACKERGLRAPEDFRLITTFGGPDLNLRTLFYRSDESQGYFMAMVEPPVTKKSDESPPADLVMLLDCSSSISPQDLELAKKAVTLLIEKCRPKDRFQVISFSSRQKRMFGSLVEAQPHNVSSAVKFVESAEPSGGTDLYNTILDACDTLGSRKRSSMILLTTDGKATIGKTTPEALIDMVKRYNRGKARIFIIAMGSSPDVATLDQIARITGGAMLQAPGAKDFDAKVSRWLSNIISPQVTELAINLKEVTTEGLIPEPAPDIIGQESIVVFGRYGKEAAGEETVNLKGKIGGKVRELIKKVNVPTEATSFDFIPAQWAMRKMAGILDLERTKGENRTREAQTKQLSSRFGFTVYDISPKFGELFADSLWKYKTSFVISDVTQSRFKRIGPMLFKCDDGSWTQLSPQTSTTTKEIKFMSDQYFDMVFSNERLGDIFALGPDVSFTNNGTCFRVVNPPAQAMPEPPGVNKD